ncbi:MAG: galactitol-1-phosphate 5-dehydrogenase [Lachnospiraceae bacterium]|nr:galactitol-1-phosphate 5-dehydrogenase [Lachnospiraceae bacterium]
MKAWVLKEAGKLIFEEVSEPVIRENEVLVKVKNCGICGSDIPRAYRDGAHIMPLIIGHEFSGEVVSAESDALSHGKRVGIFPLIPCMHCVPCLEGKYEMCRSYSYLGSRRDGGFAEYAAVPEWNLIELPDGVSFEQAAMLEPMAVAAHAVRRLGLSGNEKVAVYGQGTIGLFILMLLMAQGLRDVYVFGNHDIQKDRAVKLGLKEDSFCDIRREDAKAFALGKTAGKGFEASFEAVGSSGTYSQAVEFSAPGGQICLLGNPASDMVLERNIYWKVLRNQLRIFGTWNSSFKGGSCSSLTKNGENYGQSCQAESDPHLVKSIRQEADTKKDDWEYVLELIRDKKIKPEIVISHRYPLKELEKGFLIMRDKTGDYIKIMADIQ